MTRHQWSVQWLLSSPTSGFEPLETHKKGNLLLEKCTVSTTLLPSGGEGTPDLHVDKLCTLKKRSV